MSIKLYEHQERALEVVECLNKVAFYHDMGLGKTFTGSEKMVQLGAKVNLIICQKSKINDWVEHFLENYHDVNVCNLAKVPAEQLKGFLRESELIPVDHNIFIINYELAFRRPELKQLEHFTLMLDESSMIQNESAKRSKFILSLKPDNVILLSGTPTGGKYENLWSQLHLLGWNISKELYWRQYIESEVLMNEGFPVTVVRGYKNVERLKQKLRDHGAHFLKTEDVLDLPEQVFNTISVPTTKEYRKFKKDCIVTVEETELVGDTTLTKMLYERQLCGQYNKAKLEAFRDLLESTNDRLIVFYNFTDELMKMLKICDDVGRQVSVVNGQMKCLEQYENNESSVAFIQYQAGAMGLNLQKANKIVYFTPPLSSELYEQSKKRVHRIGQSNACFYYCMTCKNSIEERIYDTLAMRKDFTDKLFEGSE